MANTQYVEEMGDCENAHTKTCWHPSCQSIPTKLIMIRHCEVGKEVSSWTANMRTTLILR